MSDTKLTTCGAAKIASSGSIGSPRHHSPTYRPAHPIKRASDEMSYPKIRIDIDGTVRIDSAPDVAHFPLTLLQPHDRTKGIVTTSKNVVTITPTVGDPISYKVVSYDFDDARFTAEKINA